MPETTVSISNALLSVCSWPFGRVLLRNTSIMTDGFFSRPGLLRVALGRIGPDGERIDTALRTLGYPTLAAVMVAHTHYDHALDSAVVASRTGAVLVGSASIAR